MPPDAAGERPGLTGPRRSRKTKRMTSRARALSALGAYLCLGAQLLGLVHVLVVRHATCPTHGEVTHGLAAEPSSGDQPLADTIRGAPGPALEHRDEHCLLAIARRREMAGLSPIAHAAVAPLPSTAPAIAGARPLITVLAVLRLAPKTSPPAV
jgi:hypothetical protein